MKFNLHDSKRKVLYKFSFAAVATILFLNSICVYGATENKSKEYDFNKLIKGNESITLEQLLKDYPPMNLNVFVKPEYINGVVIYNAVTQGGGNITSIDISKNPNVSKYVIEANYKIYEAKLARKESIEIYNVGITSLKNGDDIKIIAKDDENKIMQSKIIKFNTNKATNRIPNPKDLSKKGVPYTFQELIKKPSLFYEIMRKEDVKLRTSIFLDDVGMDYEKNKIINTTTEMEYSVDSYNGISGIWTSCNEYETNNVPYGKSKKVFVREKINKSNYKELGNSNVKAPMYTIDYVNECTNEMIPPTVEYAEDINFTKNKKSGQNEKIKFDSSINEEKKILYFRTKATDKSLPGNVFQLTIPKRPSKPVFDVDYIKEATKQSVSSLIEYAENEEFTQNVKLGENKVLKLTPGKKLYFRVKPSSNNKTFVSEVFKLEVKNRNTSKLPYNFNVNYNDETTLEVVPTNIEYCEEEKFSKNIKQGKGEVIDLNPGAIEKYLYFRYASSENEFPGEDVYKLKIKARPALIDDEFSVDYINERTKNRISSQIQYAENEKFTYNVKNSSGDTITIKPGTTYYFRKRANESEFASLYKKVVVQPRPAATNFSIDYDNNATVENVPITVEWSNDEKFSTINVGGNGGVTAPLTINKDNIYYFRIKASDTSFAGLTQELRKMPKYTINFEKETTNEKISKDVEWSTNKNFTDATAGQNEVIKLEPGKTYYFRPRKSSQYHVQILEVPARIKMSKVTLVAGTNEGTFKLLDIQVGIDYEYIMSTSSSVPSDWSRAIHLDASNSTLDNILANGNKYIYIRIKNKGSEFASEVLSLEIKVKEKEKTK